MNVRCRTLFALTLSVIVAMHTMAANAGEIKKSFTNVDEVKIKTVSGNCVIEKGNGSRVEVVVKYTYDDEDYQPEFKQRGSRLVLSEDFLSRHTSGKSTWFLKVPETTDISFSTSSGDLEINDLKSEIDIETASGNVIINNIHGKMDVRTASGAITASGVRGTIELGTASGAVTLSKASGEIEIGTASGVIKVSDIAGTIELGTASGEIQIDKASGAFEVGAASGDIAAAGITLRETSEFEAASGDVEVKLAKSPQHNLKISSASGDAIVNFNGNAIVGFIEMTAKARRGKIKAPSEFDREQVRSKWDSEYVTKTVQRGKGGPTIEISTASGLAVLREN